MTQETVERAPFSPYHSVLLPLVASGPVSVAYGTATVHGDLRRHLHPGYAHEVSDSLQYLLGDKLNDERRASVVREYFRLRSCEELDELLLAGNDRTLMKLVKVRGKKYIDEALVAGRGAIIAGSHFGSHRTCFSILGAMGYRVTVIARWSFRTDQARSGLGRAISKTFRRNPLTQYVRGPNINVNSSSLGAAVRAAECLRNNELVFSHLDVVARPPDRSRAIQVPFLGREVPMLPGIVTIAQLTKAPILVALMHRSKDLKHQTLIISPPIEANGDPAAMLKQCVKEVETQILQNPAHWVTHIADDVLAYPITEKNLNTNEDKPGWKIGSEDSQARKEGEEIHQIGEEKRRKTPGLKDSVTQIVT
jgi:lauroyl/myristoyl acyltransferase